MVTAIATLAKRFNVRGFSLSPVATYFSLELKQCKKFDKVIGLAQSSPLRWSLIVLLFSFLNRLHNCHMSRDVDVIELALTLCPFLSKFFAVNFAHTHNRMSLAMCFELLATKYRAVERYLKTGL